MSQDIAVPDTLPDPVTGEELPATIDNATELHIACTERIRQLESWQRECNRVLAAEAQRQGTKTLYVGDWKVVLRGGTSTSYAGQEKELMAALMEVGCPPERINAACQEITKYKLNYRVITQLKAANPNYAQAINETGKTVETQWAASISRK